MSQAHDHAASHGSVKSYLTGFVLSVILTVIPFWLVMNGNLNPHDTLLTIAGFAVVQILVHLKYFLHLDFTTEGRVNTLAFLFTALVIVLLVGLSVWIIFSADALMMP
ncbi:cytochrome o ubiquinol oxidase subunit IV [Pseudogulbenkiania sp. NH8B]|jgi:cytochrome o ubiquinol oxidase operon protein cyoD|uniref:Cytochrome bo(3) ubiquinol oxidase subunit 4 n=1 Tax=Pseudogulbenkiania ferrooxidans 2002 TaxID=279714 RepID=B9Z876_9NEIS|nr:MULTISPECIES: cytochrome o ubiquinol oxidase subunit IV [Pseudogulbenkiania]EEG06979.1 cytochrome o ubiquinol oxidase subunit IV [Pseudogulbenkiania ferrooxidans 2002]BAK75333.1 cytochrome o ubiquinol oxidase subunit IV [Pseudogulbenkiania sp. NH8B]